ncbi:hypothetical protein Tco_1248323, partial [Tanacetum coccineum]
WSLEVSPSEEDFELDKPKIEQLGSEELDKRGHELFMVLAYIVSETSESNKEGPLKIAGLKEAIQGDNDDARPIAARAMRLLRSETSRVEHAEAAKGTVIGRKRVRTE